MKKKQIDKIDLLHSKIDSLQKVIKRLKQEREDLKCCGNCGELTVTHGCGLGNNNENTKNVCHEWMNDACNKKIRLERYEN